MAKKPGSTIMKELLAEPSFDKREGLILGYLLAGNVPGWALTWRPVRVRANIDGRVRELEYEVTPDYVPLGTDDDFIRIPMWPGTAQKFADAHGAILPSSRMVEEIYANASARLVPQPIAGQKSSVSEWGQHEIMVQRQAGTLGLSPGTFIAGHKKDVVIGPSLDGSRVAIFGWHDESGKITGVPNKAIQPYSTIHDSRYSDYAHGTRLVRRQASLDGEPIDLVKVFTDPKLSVLVSSQGAFNPRYPDKTPLPAGAPAGGGDGGGFQPASFIRTATSSLTASNTTTTQAKTAIKSFETGDHVRAAQATLIALGYDLGPTGADGDLGPKTSSAIQKFQVTEKLPATGKLDPATLQALRAHAVKLSAGLKWWQKIAIAMGVTGVVGGVAVWLNRGHR